MEKARPGSFLFIVQWANGRNKTLLDTRQGVFSVHLLRHVFIIGIGIFCLAGCQLWDKTKSIYRGTIFPASVNVEAEADVGENIRRVAQGVADVDVQLEKLVFGLERISGPSKEELQDVFSMLSWLNGVAAVSPSGELKYRIPEQAVKKVSSADILETMPEDQVGEVYVRSLAFELGPELCVIRSMRSGDAVSDYVVAHFDPRSLFSRAAEPEALLVIHQDDVLWSGMPEKTAQRIAEKDWKRMQAQGVQGDFRIQGTQFIWLSRYIGESPIVYVVQKKQTK